MRVRGCLGGALNRKATVALNDVVGAVTSKIDSFFHLEGWKVTLFVGLQKLDTVAK